jgi:hypothetical protein
MSDAMRLLNALITNKKTFSLRWCQNGSPTPCWSLIVEREPEHNMDRGGLLPRHIPFVEFLLAEDGNLIDLNVF